jgi:hypothetical protein
MTNQTNHSHARRTNMDWTQPPAWEPAQPPPVSPAPVAEATPSTASSFGGIRRTIATAALAVGLLVVGGTAVVLAADPSASPAPSGSTAPSGGTTTPRTHTPGSTTDCPNMGGSGSGGSTAPSTTGPSSSPTTNL